MGIGIKSLRCPVQVFLPFLTLVLSATSFYVEASPSNLPPLIYTEKDFISFFQGQPKTISWTIVDNAPKLYSISLRTIAPINGTWAKIEDGPLNKTTVTYLPSLPSGDYFVKLAVENYLYKTAESTIQVSISTPPVTTVPTTTAPTITASTVVSTASAATSGPFVFTAILSCLLVAIVALRQRRKGR